MPEVVHVSAHQSPEFEVEKRMGLVFGRLFRQCREAQSAQGVYGSRLHMPMHRFLKAVKASSCSPDAVLVEKSAVFDWKSGRRSDHVTSKPDPLLIDVSLYTVWEAETHFSDSMRSGTLILEFKSGKTKWVPILRTVQEVKKRHWIDATESDVVVLTKEVMASGVKNPDTVLEVQSIRNPAQRVGFVANQLPFDEDTVFRVERVWKDDEERQTHQWREQGKCFTNTPPTPKTGECPAPIPFMPSCSPRVSISSLLRHENLVVDVEMVDDSKTTCITKKKKMEDGSTQLVLRPLREVSCSKDLSRPRSFMSSHDTTSSEHVLFSNVVKVRGPRIASLHTDWNAGIRQGARSCINTNWSAALAEYRRYARGATVFDKTTVGKQCQLFVRWEQITAFVDGEKRHGKNVSADQFGVYATIRKVSRQRVLLDPCPFMNWRRQKNAPVGFVMSTSNDEVAKKLQELEEGGMQVGDTVAAGAEDYVFFSKMREVTAVRARTGVHYVQKVGAEQFVIPNPTVTVAREDYEKLFVITRKCSLDELFALPRAARINRSISDHVTVAYDREDLSKEVRYAMWDSAPPFYIRLEETSTQSEEWFFNMKLHTDPGICAYILAHCFAYDSSFLEIPPFTPHADDARFRPRSDDGVRSAIEPTPESRDAAVSDDLMFEHRHKQDGILTLDAHLMRARSGLVVKPNPNYSFYTSNTFSKKGEGGSVPGDAQKVADDLYVGAASANDENLVPVRVKATPDGIVFGRRGEVVATVDVKCHKRRQPFSKIPDAYRRQALTHALCLGVDTAYIVSWSFRHSFIFKCDVEQLLNGSPHALEPAMVVSVVRCGQRAHYRAPEPPITMVTTLDGVHARDGDGAVRMYRRLRLPSARDIVLENQVLRGETHVVRLTNDSYVVYDDGTCATTSAHTPLGLGDKLQRYEVKKDGRADTNATIFYDDNPVVSNRPDTQGGVSIVLLPDGTCMLRTEESTLRAHLQSCARIKQTTPDFAKQDQRAAERIAYQTTWSMWWQDLLTILACRPGAPHCLITIDPSVSDSDCRDAAVEAVVRAAEMIEYAKADAVRMTVQTEDRTISGYDVAFLCSIYKSARRPTFDDKVLEQRVVTRMRDIGIL